MAEREASPLREPDVPADADRSFQDVDGIPLDVIAELFGRAGIPAGHQRAFWQEVAAKHYAEFKGKVRRISTDAEGRTVVEVERPGSDEDGHWAQFFYHPPDLTDGQLETLKLAAKAGREVTVRFQDLYHEKGPGQTEHGSVQPVRSVSVWF